MCDYWWVVLAYLGLKEKTRNQQDEAIDGCVFKDARSTIY
jgi:hypothetical protein